MTKTKEAKPTNSIKAKINSFWGSFCLPFFAKFVKASKTCGLFCIKWRYLIALVVFIFCVAFKIHGSSIAEYNYLFDNSAEYNSESIILGKSRGIRSDEWLVHTPYYISQTYNDFEKDSNMMSLEGQDMIIGYNAPVADITLIAKPFTWGYILLGEEYGLSWYWCSKIILLVLVCFELCLIVTKGNKKIAVFGAFLIAFAPAVQWWFVPHMVDVFFWGMALMVLGYYFFTTVGRRRILFMVLLSFSAITFVLALFPSLQISVGLAMIALLVAVLIRDKKKITFKKQDIWRIVVMAIFVVAVLGYTLVTSKDAIIALNNTVYPGSRVETGGNDQIKSLFTDLTTFYLPFKNITYSNSSEISTFIHFAPIFLMLYPIIRKKLKKDQNMIVGDVLVGCLVVMIVFMLAGFPELLAKLTLFSYINRMKMAYGLIATIFTVWGISMIWKKQIFTRKQILITLAIYGFLYVCFVNANELTYMSWEYYGIVIAGLVLLAYLMLAGRQKLFLTGTSLLILISGCTINPIAHGISALTSHPLEQKIHEIATEDPEAYWLTSGSIQLASITVSNGARTLNMTNFYPDSEKWEILDPAGTYSDVYNRYAHILTELTEEATQFELGASPDQMKLKINYDDLDKIQVKYLLVMDEFDNDKYAEIYKDTEGQYYIYERVYNE